MIADQKARLLEKNRPLILRASFMIDLIETSNYVLEVIDSPTKNFGKESSIIQNRIHGF